MDVTYNDIVTWSILGASLLFFGVFFAKVFFSTPLQGKTSHAVRLRTITQSSTLGFWIDFQDAIFSIVASAAYVTQTYYGDRGVMVFYGLDLFVSVFFGLNYFTQLYTSRDRPRFLVSTMALIDVLTVVPVFITVFLRNYDNNSTSFFRVYRLLKVARVFRLMRLLRSAKFAKKTSQMDDALTSQLLDTVTKFICLVFIIAGLSQAMETPEEGWQSDGPMQFHDALYFVMITLSTVGYGDISPPNWSGRLFVICIVMLFIYFVPTESTRISELVSMRSKYEGAMKKSLQGRQIIIGCNSSCVALFNNFLSELFHEDHGLVNDVAVALVPGEPDMEWQATLLQYNAGDRLTYLKGDLRNPADMQRVGMASAKAVFILADRNAADTWKEDTNTLMRVICCQDYAAHQDRPLNLAIFAQVVHKETMDRLISIGLPSHRIVCIEQIKTRMLSNACLWHGWPTFINNLIASVGALAYDQNSDPTLVEHFNGIGKEVYTIELAAFAGQSFHRAALGIFRTHASILLGLLEKASGKVLLNPGDVYTVCEGDLGFVIADDAEVVEKMFEAVDADVKRHSTFAFEDNVPAPPEDKDEEGAAGGSGAAPQRTKGGGGVEEPAPRPPLASPRKKPSEPAPTTRGGRAASRGSLEDVALQLDATREGRQGQGEGGAGRHPSHLVISRQGTKVRRFSIPAQRQRGHVVLLVEQLDTSLPYFIEFISARHIVDTTGAREVKVVCERSPASAQVDAFLEANGIELIHGPLTKESLLRAGAPRASCVVLFGRKHGQGLHNVDAEALAVLMEMFSLVGSSVRFVVELFNETYNDQVALLDARAMDLGALMARLGHGESFRSPGMNVQLNNHLSELLKPQRLKEPLLQSNKKEMDRIDKLMRKLRTCNGDVVLTNFSELLLSQAYFNAYAVPLVNALLSYSVYRDRVTCCIQIKIPEPFFRNENHFHTFGELFKYFMDTYGALALGIFRQPEENENTDSTHMHSPQGSTSKQKLKRVRGGILITSPSHGFEVLRQDLVFVLSNPHNMKQQSDDANDEDWYAGGRRTTLSVTFAEAQEMVKKTSTSASPLPGWLRLGRGRGGGGGDGDRDRGGSNSHFDASADEEAADEEGEGEWGVADPKAPTPARRGGPLRRGRGAVAPDPALRRSITVMAKRQQDIEISLRNMEKRFDTLERMLESICDGFKDGNGAHHQTGFGHGFDFSR